MNATGLLLCDDLIFSSRINATARAAGVPMKTVRSSEQLEVLARQEPPGCVIVDLANPTLRIAEFVARMRETCSLPPRIVAYGSHVDVETLRAAREAGCDVVLPRSKFVEDLETELASWVLGNEVRP